MTKKPILFSASMVLALLAGEKSQTRRTIKIIGKPDDYVFGYISFRESHETLTKGSRKAGTYAYLFNETEDEPYDFLCPYGNVGDYLWVRESFYPKYVKGGLQGFQNQYPEVYPWVYKADNPDFNTHGFGWKPSIHMPYQASRLWLKITSLRVERLQNINPVDAIHEGIEAWNVDFTSEEGAMHADFKNYMWRDDEKYEDFNCPSYSDSIASFSSLWQFINGVDSWLENPWVWVVDFEVVSTLGKENIKI